MVYAFRKWPPHLRVSTPPMAALTAPAALAAAAANEAASVSQQPLDLEFAMTMRQIELALSPLG